MLNIAGIQVSRYCLLTGIVYFVWENSLLVDQRSDTQPTENAEESW
jgi:hypothetical protein